MRTNLLPARLAVVALTASLVHLAWPLAAQEARSLPLPSVEQLREGGREALSDWIAERAARGPVVVSRPEREFRASVELALQIHAQSGGDLLTDALSEAEDRIPAALQAQSDPIIRARLAAVLGKLYQSLQGDVVRARLWYENALRLDPDDEMAREGLQKLAIADAVAERKQRENERLVELERAMDRPVASP